MASSGSSIVETSLRFQQRFVFLNKMIKLISIDECCQTESEPKRDKDAGGAGSSAAVKMSRPILSRK